MRVSIQTNNSDANGKLTEQIKDKVGKLEHFFENIVDAMVYLHESNTYKEVEIKLLVPNDTLFVKEQGETYQAALDVAVDTMKRNIKRYKERTLKNN